MVGANFIIAYFSEWRFCNTRILVYGVLACGFFFIVGFWFIWEVWNIFSPYFDISGLEEYFGLCHILACRIFAREQNSPLGQQEEPV